MDLNLMLQMVMGLVTVVSVFVIVKQKVQQHDETFKTMHQELKESFKKRDDEAKEEYAKLDSKINICFSKYDEVKEEQFKTQMTLSQKVTLKEVNDEFITRKELDLRLQLIETTTTNTNREVGKMEKQLEEVLFLLQNKKV